jgi:peptidoglycan-N-acetylglucosamine deacetylase
VTDGARVALTFDAEHPDRPNSGDQSAAILAALDTAGAPATFFLQGRWVEAMPGVARSISAAGHLIGNHSHYHARMSHFSDEFLRADVTTAEEVIREAVCADPRPWFRAPFGDGAERQDLVDVLNELGYRHIGWHVDVNEWRSEHTPDSVANAIMSGVRAYGDGAVVLLHTWPDTLRDGLPDVLRQLAAEGVRFVTVDELDLPPGLGSVGEPRPEPVAPSAAAG